MSAMSKSASKNAGSSSRRARKTGANERLSVLRNRATRSQTNRRILRILLVEDSELDMILLLRSLQRGGFEILHHRVATASEMRVSLETGVWDLILADHAMPGFSAPEALELVKRAGLDIPFIIVSGH